jgi:hypothetical protein
LPQSHIPPPVIIDEFEQGEALFKLIYYDLAIADRQSEEEERRLLNGSVSQAGADRQSEEEELLLLHVDPGKMKRDGGTKMVSGTSILNAVFPTQSSNRAEYAAKLPKMSYTRRDSKIDL